MNQRYSFRLFKGVFGLAFAMLTAFTQLNAQTVKTYTTAGTYTFAVPACVTSITVMCWGGGGGGGWAGEPSSGATGSGGGGGGFAQTVLSNVSGSFTVTVGGAGNGGTGSSSTNATAGGNSIVTNGTITVTGVGGGAGIGSGSGVSTPGGAGGGATFVGCTGTTYKGGSGAVGNNGDDNTGGAGGGGAGSGGNGGTPATTTQDNNATGGVGGIGSPNTAPYIGGTGGGVSAAYHENGNPGTGIGAGGGGGGGEDQFFHGTGYGNGGTGTAGQVIITYSVSTPTITSVTGSGCVGSTVTITGTLLSGATSVTINGTAVTGLTITNTQIAGTIAAGTTTGTVTVNTPCGNVSSAAPFTVYPSSVVNLGTHTFCTSYTFGGQTYTTGGNYTTTVPSTVSGCDSTTNITLVKASQITQSIAESICAGSGYSFGGHNYTTAGTYKDTTTSTISGCDSITTLTLTVEPVLQQAITQTICSGTSYSFGNRMLTVAGTYLDTVPSAATGCDSITTLTLHVSQTPNATITPPTASVCPGVNTTLTASTAPLYLWSTGATTSAITVAPTATTGYTVTESSSDGVCTASASATLTVTPFAISITPDTTLSCIAAPVTLTCSYTSTNPNSYSWSSVPAATTPGISQGVVVYPLVTTLYSVTVSNGSCTASASALVIVDTPSVTITPSVVGVCVGNDTTLTASGSSTYVWSNGTGTATNLVSPTVTTKYMVTATDANGCKATDSITVTVGAVPTATFTAVSPVCAGVASSIAYTGTSDSNAVYNWYFGGGGANTGTGKGPYQVTWNNAGLDTIILNVADNGCFATPDTITVTVKPLPTPVAGVPVSFCGGDSAVLGGAATTGYTYVWNPSTGLNSDTLSSPTISLTNPGGTRLSVTYTVTASSNGCTGSDSVQVMVLPAPIAKFAVTPSAAQCLNGNKFTFTSDGSFLPTDSFSWVFGANATPAISGSETQSVTYSAAQTTTVSLSIGRAGCESPVYTDSVTIYPMPVAAFNAPAVTGCPGVSLCFANTSVATGNITYLWTFGDGETGSTQTPCHVYSNTGIYTVSLLVNANGCLSTATDSNYVTINVAPTASFTPSASIIQQPQSDITFTNTSTNANTYNWNFGGLATSTDISPTYSFTQYGSYNVTLYAANSFGCQDSAVVPIKVLPGQTYFIPNAFTPNGDGKDDDFYIQMQEGVTVISFTVFDRWGEKVHDGPNPWDGTFNGHVCQPGVYVYLFKLRLVDDMDGIRREGTVTLIR